MQAQSLLKKLHMITHTLDIKINFYNISYVELKTYAMSLSKIAMISYSSFFC